ncbi:MAG TPA: glycerol kinase GlpK [Tepidisphaeraceae bacterium]|nr:glycerol kinase GlpK [Tepidisphaeraceae bacterium]
MAKYIAAIDQGTTSTRCILFDHQKPVAIAQKEHRQIFPRPGWVEHDPVEIWQRTQEVVVEAMQRAGATAPDIAAVGITNQRETTLAWDRETGRPYHNAIVWQDTRTQGICDALAREGGVDRFRECVGLPLATYFSATKLRWMLDHVTGLREEAAAGRALFGTVDAWLLWNLTGGHVTDVTNASRTMLMDLRTLQWDEAMLRAFDVPRSMLPQIAASSHPDAFGRTKRDGPFGGEIQVCGVLGDQQAALVGQACFDPGEAKNTYGTGCFMLLNTGEQVVQSKAGLVTTLAYQRAGQPARYALEGSIAVTGALVQWLRDNLGIIRSSGEIEALAASVPDNGGVYIVPAFSGLFAPHWRPDARGTIVGLTAFSTRAHLARAALEAAAFQTADVLAAMRSDSGVDLASLKVDGGMAANGLLMQFQADVLGIPVVRPRVSETTALGAAYAAGLAVGFWKEVDELRDNWIVDRTWQPQFSAQRREQLHATWLRAVERSFGWM